MQTISDKNNKRNLQVIYAISILIPLAVAFLFFGNNITKIPGLDVSYFPHINAVLNSLTFICLMVGGLAIRQKNVKIHRASMMSAFLLSSVFLVSYVLYHNNAPHTKFGGEGLVKMVYLAILLTHILLAIAVVPFVLLAIYYAWTGQIESHKKIVKYTYPIWSYVAFSGVVVYLMISPYYK